MKLIRSILILLIFCSQYVFAQPDRGVTNKPTGEKRLALVIGNGAYQKTSELPNPPNDAADMASTLKELGFEVLSGTNQSKRQMETLIREFGDKLARQGGVGLFFYAGHGLQVKGSNYLIPVEADIPAEDEIDYAAINLDFLLKKMASAGNDLNIVILDACRNNPFARSWRNFRDIGEGSGLAKITPPTGTIMLYATQPGNVASDGSGRNGLFTESLLNQIKKPDVELDTMIKALARDVSEKSEKKQFPWKEGIATGDFYFAGGGNGPRPLPTPTVIISNNAEEVLWKEVAKLNTKLAVESYLIEYPKGKYAATARLKLQVIDADDLKKAQDIEQKKWGEAVGLNTIESYQSFLQTYPTSEYKDVANQKIKVLNENLILEKRPQKGKSRKNSMGMEFMGIPAGTFLMGSPKNEDEREKDETPHSVTLSQGFWLGKYEVTQLQWKTVMGSVPESCYEKNDLKGDNRPVVCVSWEDVQEFINKLNALGQEKYRLPTEAEWEYAARAGTADAFFFGKDENDLCKYGNGKDPWAQVWMGKTMCKDYIKGTTKVGKFEPNDFGLHDTAGNVWEWVSDWYGDYSNAGQTDPEGPCQRRGSNLPRRQRL